MKVPVAYPIRQLIISPHGDLLAILTSHTVHVAILPDASHLGQADTGPFKLKTDMLGPTTHVTSQSAVASAIWHPLGVAGTCLVTVTADAVVRVWELNRENRWSFESPTLAIDMRKLANGVSADEDYGPPKARSREFSVDLVDMEVAAACFGGLGHSDEHGWAAMTLWVAMNAGDIYALCPLLPTKWEPPATLLPSLSASVVTKTACLQDDDFISDQDRRDSQHQYEWFSEIDNQDPIIRPGASEFTLDIEVYTRPSNPGPVPRLQGPFDVEPFDSEDVLELTDIHIAAAKVNAEDMWQADEGGSEYGEPTQSGLSAAVIALLTKSGRVHICLDLDGVEGKWLPSTKVSAASLCQGSLLDF